MKLMNSIFIHLGIWVNGSVANSPLSRSLRVRIVRSASLTCSFAAVVLQLAVSASQIPHPLEYSLLQTLHAHTHPKLVYMLAEAHRRPRWQMLRRDELDPPRHS